MLTKLFARLTHNKISRADIKIPPEFLQMDGRNVYGINTFVTGCNLCQILVRNLKKSVENDPIVKVSGSTFERESYSPNAEPDLAFRFSDLVNLEPELRVRFGPVQVRTDS